MKQSRSLLILCGESAYRPDNFDLIITLSPVRCRTLRETGIDAHSFSEWAPDEESGKSFDLALYQKLDFCLHAEAGVNSELRWAPAAYLPVLLRLSRYCWLKQTILNIFLDLSPACVYLSTDNDRDLVIAINAATESKNITIMIGNGDLDQATAMLPRVRAHTLPLRIDPIWMIKLRWLLWVWLFGKRKYFVQPYWNFNLKNPSLFFFRSHSAINLLGRVLEKLFEVLKLKNKSALSDKTVELVTNITDALHHDEWRKRFSSDEILVINNILHAFMADYRPELLDQIERALVVMFETLGTRRVVMLHDRLDTCRLMAHAARRAEIPVDYLPHGIVLEDFSGKNSNSRFSPNRVLAWNEASAQYFKESGWAAETIMHPQFDAEPLPYCPLIKNWRGTKVLVLVPDWICVTHGEQEDCLLTDLAQIYDTLTQLGVHPQNITVKFHSGTTMDRNAKRAGLAALQKAAKMDFRLVDAKVRTTTLIVKHDLVVMGITTGIFEAVMLGVPLVIYGLSPSRAGSIAGSHLPFAKTANDLSKVLLEYDNKNTAETYTVVKQALRLGKSIEAALDDITA